MIPPSKALLLPLLRHAAERAWKRWPLILQMCDELGLSEEERRQRAGAGKSVRTTIDIRLGQARQDLRKIGFVDYPAEKWIVLSQKGREFLETHTGLDDTVLASLLVAQLSGRPIAAFTSEGALPDASPPKTSDADLTRAEAVDALLAYIHAQRPEFFEKLSLELVIQMGYGGQWTSRAKVTGGPNDGGIDAVLPLDALGFDCLLLQSKRYKIDRPVRSRDIQTFAGALSLQHAKKGIFLTTSDYTKEARRLARQSSGLLIKLVNGKELADFMIRFEMGVKAGSAPETYKLDPNAFFHRALPAFEND